MDKNLNSLFASGEDDLFYFESDHLALKGNKDYCEVLKTLVMLSAQREKAIKDFNKVVQLRKDAIEDPFGTLEKIQNGDDLGVPPMIRLPKIPFINFEKFETKVQEEQLKMIYSETPNEKVEVDIKSRESNNTGNYNKNWTPEEQKRLEELLITYPPEPVENRRFQKIANALGNRTVQQVSSRVQKYFLKLYRAGLPIPGRIPKSGERYKKSNLHRHQRHNSYLWKPTTFFPDLYVPVMMDDLDNIPGPTVPYQSSPSTSTSTSSNYLLPAAAEYHDSGSETARSKSSAELQLDLLRRIRVEKAREQEGSALFSHVGYRCDFCDEEPIVGTRWHCATCSDSIDFCTDCVLSQMYSENCHPLQHVLAVFHDGKEYPSLPEADSDSGSSRNDNGSKTYESDSNNSGDFGSSSNLDKLMEYESNCDTILEDAESYDNLLGEDAMQRDSPFECNE